MSDEMGSAPAAATPAASAPGSTPAAGDVSQSSASAGSGNAPGIGVDAVASEGAPGVTPAAVAAAKFRFLNREFSDPKHAETVLGSEITRARKTQSELAAAQTQLEAVNNEVASLRAMVAQTQGQGQGQGVPRGSQPPAGPKSFARELAETGELQLIGKMFVDPELGPEAAMYRMAELLDARQSKSVEQLREEIGTQTEQRETRSNQERAIAKTFGVVKNLAQTYPELDEDNQSEEAASAQQEILGIIKATFPPEILAQNPERVLRMAVEEYRRNYGTPMFAQEPGTSDSPSARAAAAAEAAGIVAPPIEGSGVPRQRANGQPETAADRWKRESREIKQKIATTPSGRPLGFTL